MDFFAQLLSNKVLIISVSSWALAQVLKTIIDFALTKEFNFERLVGAGGMPSCHAATVCSLATGCALCYGAGSFEFAISTILAIIVMYDARGVRRETGTQAVVLNQILEYFSNLDDPKKTVKFSEEKLKELVGHTPFQVVCGAVLGIVFAIIVFQLL